MPSSLIVRCVPIKKVRPHPNADNLLIIDIMGWQVCTHKDTEPEEGELRVFIPPDAILPEELAEQLEVTKYLKKGNRVGQVRLRGEMSFGIAASNYWNFEIGEEVSQKLGITKYEPPIDSGPGMQECDHPAFINYSAIENLRNFPDAFQDGEEVYVFEKIEGTNSKIGGVRIPEGSEWPKNAWPMHYDPIIDEDRDNSYWIQFMIGSHSTRKKFAVEPKDQSLYQLPYTTKVQEALQSLMHAYHAKVVIFYGEIFGAGVPNGVKSMRYGRGHKEWRLFDVYIDGKFVDCQTLLNIAVMYDLPIPPWVYQGPFSMGIIRELANRKTSLMDKDPHLSEGVVIHPTKERLFDGGRRLVLKFKSEEYEILKAKGKVEEVAS